MPGIFEFPKLIQDAIARYGDLFANECQRRHLAEYQTGLIVAQRKTVLGIHDEFAETTDQSCLNRFLTGPCGMPSPSTIGGWSRSRRTPRPEMCFIGAPGPSTAVRRAWRCGETPALPGPGPPSRPCPGGRAATGGMCGHVRPDGEESHDG